MEREELINKQVSERDRFLYSKARDLMFANFKENMSTQERFDLLANSYSAAILLWEEKVKNDKLDKYAEDYKQKLKMITVIHPPLFWD